MPELVVPPEIRQKITSETEFVGIYTDSWASLAHGADDEVDFEQLEPGDTFAALRRRDMTDKNSPIDRRVIVGVVDHDNHIVIFDGVTREAIHDPEHGLWHGLYLLTTQKEGQKSFADEAEKEEATPWTQIYTIATTSDVPADELAELVVSIGLC